MNATSIPAELRERRQWVAWRSERRDGKATKVPYSVATGERASSTDPQTWTTFETAVEFAQPHADGVGYVFSAEDPFVGVDLDACVGDANSLHPAAAEIIERLSSYTELSPSGTGVHVIVRAKLPPGARNRTGRTPWGGTFECYEKDRFFTVTGESIELLPHRSIEERQRELERPLAELFPPAASNGGPPLSPRSSGRTDAEVLERAFAAKNGGDIERLYRGDHSAYASRSEADLALLAVAFWTGPDEDQLDRLFRGAGLMREKWERQDYREATISTALEGSEFFDWERTRGSESVESVGDFRGRNGMTDSRTPPVRGVRERVRTPGEPLVGDSDTEVCEAVSPFALALDDFIAAKSDAPVALLGDEDEAVFPTAGLMILFAKGGRGKTTLTVELAFHFASGVDWLGFPIARPLRVLFIENEGPREPFRAKLELKAKLWEHDLRGALFVHTLDWGAFTFADRERTENMRAFIEQHDIDLVIGDPLDSLGVDGVGSPEDARRFMELMSSVGLFREVAFLLLHHPRKEGAADELDEAAGAWGGKPDTMLRLERKEGNRARLSFPKVRWSRRGSRPAFILAFDPDTESFTVAHEEEAEERDYVAEIEALLGDGVWRIVKEIARPEDKGGIGANVDLVRETLEKRPDLFVSRTGEHAKALGRSAQATVWQLAGSRTDKHRKRWGGVEPHVRRGVFRRLVETYFDR